MTEDVCELSDLPPESCACPRHRGGEVVEVVPDGQPFEAAYAGLCWRCDGPIRPGDTIIRTAEASGYVHYRRCSHG